MSAPHYQDQPNRYQDERGNWFAILEGEVVYLEPGRHSKNDAKPKRGPRIGANHCLTLLPDKTDCANPAVFGMTWCEEHAKRLPTVEPITPDVRSAIFNLADNLAAAAEVEDRQAILDAMRAIEETHRSIGTEEDAKRKPPTGHRLVELVPASSIKPRPVRWLWEERIPLGALTLDGGREGIGKSTLAYTLAADITRGRLPGTHHGQPKAVIVAATEDSWAHTIVPRLMAADADLDRVYRVDVTTAEGVQSELSLPRDIGALEHLIKEADAALILLDPLMSRLDAALDTHKDAEVRLALEPLVRLADVANVAVLGLIHVNKSTSSDPLSLIMASRAFVAVARAVLFVMADPDNDGQRLIGQAKNNLGRTDLPTLTFRIVSTAVAETEEGVVFTGQLVWGDNTERSLGDVIESAQATAGERSATAEAVDWLSDYLSAHSGGDYSSEIKAAGKKAGHTIDALHAARKKLRLTSTSEGFPRRTFWRLPDAVVEPVVDSCGETLYNSTTTTTGPQSSQSLQLSQSWDSPEGQPTTGEWTDALIAAFDAETVDVVDGLDGPVSTP
jgi:hypothetical protein